MEALRRTLIGLFLLLVVVAIGALGFWYFEGLTPLEAFYMTITTITTVGYGDITPHTFHGLMLRGYSYLALV